MSPRRRRTMLVLLLTLAVVLASVGLAPAAVAAAPANDDFENAEVIGPDDVGCHRFYFGDRSLAEATAQTGEPAHAGAPADQSIWFKVTPPASGNGSIGFYPTQEDALRLAAYTGA